MAGNQETTKRADDLSPFRLKREDEAAAADSESQEDQAAREEAWFKRSGDLSPFRLKRSIYGDPTMAGFEFLPNGDICFGGRKIRIGYQEDLF